MYRQANDTLARYSGHPPARFWLLHHLRTVWRSQVPWWRRKDLRLGRRRMAIALVQLLGLSYPQAAQALRCTPADIRAWIAQARNDLITDARGA